MAEISFPCALPEELITEILLRLPVRSLLRFKSTCRRWYTIITSSRFVDLHFHRESNPTRLLMLTLIKGEQQFSSTQEEEVYRLEDINQLKVYGSISTLCGPCKGIFCVCIDAYHLALWNPATRWLRFLPSPDVVLPGGHGRPDIGFGVDPSTDDLKIIWISDPPRIYDTPLGERSIFIYESSTYSWSHIGNFHINSTWSRGATFLKGYCYWLVSCSLRGSHRSSDGLSILAFDMHKEVFNEIEIPNGYSSYTCSVHLDVYDNSLALINTYDLWVMKEHGCWTKLYRFIPFNSQSTLLGCWKKKMVVFVSAGEGAGEVILYDPRPINMETLFVTKRDRPLVWYLRHSLNYKESLTAV